MANGQAVAAGASPTSAIGDVMAGGAPAAGPGAGGQAANAMVTQVAGQVRQLNNLAQQLAETTPAIAGEMQQISELLKAAVVKVATLAQQQTASSAAVPGGGM